MNMSVVACYNLVYLQDFYSGILKLFEGDFHQYHLLESD